MRGSDSDGKRWPVATVVHEFKATDDGELTLHVSEVVHIKLKDKSGWWAGMKENGIKVGWFPAGCVREVPPMPTREPPR